MVSGSESPRTTSVLKSLRPRSRLPLPLRTRPVCRMRYKFFSAAVRNRLLNTEILSITGSDTPLNSVLQSFVSVVRFQKAKHGCCIYYAAAENGAYGPPDKKSEQDTAGWCRRRQCCSYVRRCRNDRRTVFRCDVRRSDGDDSLCAYTLCSRLPGERRLTTTARYSARLLSTSRCVHEHLTLYTGLSSALAIPPGRKYVISSIVGDKSICGSQPSQLYCLTGKESSEVSTLAEPESEQKKRHTDSCCYPESSLRKERQGELVGREDSRPRRDTHQDTGERHKSEFDGGIHSIAF